MRWILAAAITAAFAGSALAQDYDDYDDQYAEPSYQPETTDTGYFVDQLAPYGRWLNVDGQTAWQPDPSVVGYDFVPYQTDGRWVYSDAGWTFASDLPFAWATFHYGNWFNSPQYGWIWFPGSTWAPAWVDWRYGDGYVGWAPIPPADFTVGFDWYDSPAYWAFVPETHFVDQDFHRYVRHDHDRDFFRHTRRYENHVQRGHTFYNAGPPPQRFAPSVQQHIAHVNVQAPRPGVIRPIHVPASGQQPYVRQPVRGGTPEHQAVPSQPMLPEQRPIPTERPQPGQTPRPAPAPRTVTPTTPTQRTTAPPPSRETVPPREVTPPREATPPREVTPPPARTPVPPPTHTAPPPATPHAAPPTPPPAMHSAPPPRPPRSEATPPPSRPTPPPQAHAAPPAHSAPPPHAAPPPQAHAAPPAHAAAPAHSAPPSHSAPPAQAHGNGGNKHR